VAIKNVHLLGFRSPRGGRHCSDAASTARFAGYILNRNLALGFREQARFTLGYTLVPASRAEENSGARFAG
jgi:hypothetical protein